MGSGTWVRSLKDKNILSKVILDTFDNFEDCKTAEERIIESVFDHKGCMNFNKNSVGFASGDLNPAHLSHVKEANRIRGKKTIERAREFSQTEKSKEKRISSLQKFYQDNPDRIIKGNDHHTKDEKYRKSMSDNNPMYNEDVRQKLSVKIKDMHAKGLIEKREMSDEEKQERSSFMKINNPMKDPEIAKKLRVPKRKITCPHCGFLGAIAGLKRYHFDKCKKLDQNTNNDK